MCIKTAVSLENHNQRVVVAGCCGGRQSLHTSGRPQRQSKTKQFVLVAVQNNQRVHLKKFQALNKKKILYMYFPSTLYYETILLQFPMLRNLLLSLLSCWTLNFSSSFSFHYLDCSIFWIVNYFCLNKKKIYWNLVHHNMTRVRKQGLKNHINPQNKAFFA